MPLDVDPGKFGQERDPQSERRVIVLMIVAFVVLVAWSNMMGRLYPSASRPAAPTEMTVRGAGADLSPPGPPAVTPALPLAPAVAEVPSDVPEASRYEPIADAEARSAVVVTDTFEATFTNEGARLRSLKLRAYAEAVPARGEAPRALETIPREAIDLGRLPLALQLPARPELEAALNGARFTVDPPRLELKAGEEGAVTFRHRTASGVEVDKTIRFHGGSYLMELHVRVRQLPVREADGTVKPEQVIPARVTWGPGFSNPPPELLSAEGGYASYDYFGRAFYHADRRTSRTPKASVKAPFDIAGDVSWAGLEERYFAVVFLPDGRFEAVGFQPQKVKPPQGAERQELVLSVGAGQPLQLFVGPKEYAVLKSTHPALPDVIDFGRWLGGLVKVMLFALKRLEAKTGNYGTAIILLTIFIKLLLFPLTLSSYRSMKRMQKLQPKMNAIREKYKRQPTDAAERREHKMKMNDEIMGLYKKEGVNPVGGCFPLLLQMPFLISFYSLLSVAIELRQAPFYLWIHDLSQKDPLYITPILMTLAQFVSQKLSPVTTPDPVQQRMMTLMPLFFLFMFVQFPSGLVIYWLTSNVFQIVQQLILNRLDARPAAVAAGARS